MTGLVSVIIPVYNVAAYLPRCMESVLNQTYANLEIILVDDGSTDESPRLCDEYAAKDARVTVIHKENGGQASARNAALDVARGEYLLFIDSDDYVSRDHIALLAADIDESGADMAVCSLIVSSSGSEKLNARRTTTLNLDGEGGIYEMMIARRFSFSPCTKLYRRSMFENIRFPEGVLYEDMFFACKVCMAARKIVFSDDVTYCYFIRKGSTVNSRLRPEHFSGFDALREQREIFADNPRIQRAIDVHYIARCMEFMKQVSADQPELFDRIWRETTKYRWSALTNREAPPRVRVYAALSYLGKRITLRVVHAYYRRK